MKQKSISNENIETALAAIDEAEYLRILKDVLKLKSKSIKAETEYERKQKLARFAAGRGFEPGLDFKLLDMDDEF